MLIIPSGAFVSLLLEPALQGHIDLIPVAQQFLDAYKEDPGNAQARGNLEQLCREVLAQAEDEYYSDVSQASNPDPTFRFSGSRTFRILSDRSITYIAVAGAALGDLNIMEQAFSLVWTTVPTDLMRPVGYHLHLQVFETFQGVLFQAMGHMDSFESVIQALSELKTGMLRQLETELGEAQKSFLSKFSSWSATLLRQMLAQAGYSPTEKASTLLSLQDWLQADLALTD